MSTFARELRKRVPHLVLVLLAVSLITTLLLELVPGDPARSLVGEAAPPEQVDAVRDRLGLDEPLPARYASWVGGVITGDLGTSIITGEPVGQSIVERLPVTLELSVLALLVALAVAIPLGIVSAYREGGLVDRISSVIAAAFISAPTFLTALLFTWLFAVRWQIFPVVGWVPLTEDPADNLRHAVLPVLSLASLEIAVFLRLLRSDMIATLREDYILAAKATGIPDRQILLRHALRPSAFSLVTVAGLVLARLLGGAVIVEVMFAVPGIGQYLVSGIFNRDLPVIQGSVLFVAVSYVVVNLIVDLTYQWLDPRVRVDGG